MALSLLTFARPSAAQLQLEGALPEYGLICENSGCTWLSEAETYQRLQLFGMPYEIWDICHGAYFDCHPGDSGYVGFVYAWGWGGWSWVGSTAEMPGFASQVAPNQPGPLGGFNCAQADDAYFYCYTGTGGPGWQWKFYAMYYGWW